MNSPSERAVRWMLALPRGVAELVVVLISVAMSVAFTAASLQVGEPTDAMRHWSLLLAVVVPTVVAGPVAAVLMHLLRALDAARTHAQRLAHVDVMTGLPNRRHWLGMAHHARHESRAAAQTLMVMLLDVDDFKAVNDGHGHAAGDAVLVSVAQICSESLRQGDLAARWGGEEFVVLMRGASTELALQVAERLRAAVSERAVLYETARGATQALVVTVSVGVADVGEGSLEQALVRADAAMYRAKVSGKNRCMLAEPALKAA